MPAVLGIYNHPQATWVAELGLHSLLHRGPKNRVVCNSKGEVSLRPRGQKLDESARDYTARAAIGQTFHEFSGFDIFRPPLLNRIGDDMLAVVYDGELTNVQELRSELMKQGVLFSSSAEVEVVMTLLAQAARTSEADWGSILRTVLRKLQGAFAMLFLTKDTLIAARDPYGIRPLVMGVWQEAVGFSSETRAFDFFDVGSRMVREVDPGVVVVVRQKSIRTDRFSPPEETLFQCVFEHVYYSCPDSVVFGRSVADSRIMAGRILAQEQPAQEADVVVAVPDSGVFAAIGFAEESEIPYAAYIIRNHYIGRTLIEPLQHIRDFGTSLKFNPITSAVRGKRIVLVDDSIVRGKTARKVIALLRSAGAREIHLRIACLPIISPCFYGVHTPPQEEMIAARDSVEEIRQCVNADTLGYLSMQGLQRSLGEIKAQGCYACMTGDYPTALPAGRKLVWLKT